MQANYYAKLYNHDQLTDIPSKLNTDRGIVTHYYYYLFDGTDSNNMNIKYFVYMNFIIYLLSILIGIFGIYCLNLIIIKYGSYHLINSLIQQGKYLIRFTGLLLSLLELSTLHV